MADIGQRADLPVLTKSPHGLFLDAGDPLGEVLLPRKEVSDSMGIGDLLDVFIYCDSQDRPVATLKQPKAMPGEFACLQCVDTTAIGAFLDWGLDKDLFSPFREQTSRLEVGKRYVVYVYVDPSSDRIVASRRLNRHFSKEHPSYRPGEEVSLMIYAHTDLGYKAIIDGKHAGVLFANEVFQTFAPGETTRGYIAKVRPDGKIDLTLQAPGRAHVNDLESRIESELTARGGFWELCDSSPAESIYAELGVSKKAFKKATGALYRKRKITIGKDGIRLV
jgi:predicted RNA-binding protein (virulence factor B family)